MVWAGAPQGKPGHGAQCSGGGQQTGPRLEDSGQSAQGWHPAHPAGVQWKVICCLGLVYKASWPSFPPRCIFTFRQPVLGDTHCTRQHTSCRTTHATPDSNGRGLQGEMGAMAGSPLLAGGVVLPARWGLFSHSVPGSTSQGASRTQGPGPAQSPWQAGSRARSPLPDGLRGCHRGSCTLRSLEPD